MKVKTYNSKEVTMSIGSHIVTGFADGSFITIEQSGDGVSKVVGAHGEVQRSISPDKTYAIGITLLWGSDTNAWLNSQVKKDQENSNAIFPTLIKDLIGNTLFQAEESWVVKNANITFDQTAQNREWSIETGEAELT
jgi:hypothetical protein